MGISLSINETMTAALKLLVNELQFEKDCFKED